MTISAKVIADSINHKNIRITTLLLEYPRFIHAELLTHRMLSRNSSSSRAIPIQRVLDSIRRNPVYPYHGKNQKGMQAENVLSIDGGRKVDEIIDDLRNYTITAVERLEKLELHKQHTNRLLEPFSHISTLVTATEWNNFLALRTHKDAQPEIQSVANLVKTCLKVSTPIFKEDNEWHLPFITTAEEELTLKEKLMLSVAKCATISYARQEQPMTLQKAAEIFERLTKSNPIHASPFEHQAKPIADSNEASHLNLSDNELWCGNFRGWMQYRHTIKNNYLPY